MNVGYDGVEYSLPLSSHNKRLEQILHKHAQLFEEGLGTV